jgi:hypothetical protein
VQDRFAGDGHVTGRAEQFEVVLRKGHVVIRIRLTVRAGIVPVKRSRGTRRLPGGVPGRREGQGTFDETTAGPLWSQPCTL